MGNGIMVALLPSYYDLTPVEIPHLTIVYAGTTEERSATDISALTKDATTLALMLSPMGLQVMGLEVFGDEEPVKVLTFAPTPQLISARKFLEGWNKSEHSFNPHMTIGPESTEIEVLPRGYYFDRLSVNWGEKSLVIPLL